MKFFWIFGFEWWGDLRPAEMRTSKGDRYVPLFFGIWLRRPTKHIADVWHMPAPIIGHPDDVKDDPKAKIKKY